MTKLKIFRANKTVIRERETNLSRAFELLADLPDNIDLPDRAKDLPQKRTGIPQNPKPENTKLGKMKS